ncbi:MAG: dTMP kinase [Candidatus Nanohaloarchaea archaeon]
MKEHDLPGTFIVIEGADGAGTTTQSKRLVEELEAHYTFEPTDDLVGRKVDEMISSGDYSADAIALAFAADRMAHLEEEVIPRLEDGETVVCDRYYHSSLVYQPALGADFDWVKQLNRHALVPDLTVILDISADEGLSRVEKRGSDGNIFENLDFQQKVVLRYRELEDRLDENVTVIDGARPEDEVFSELLEKVGERL